MMRTINSQELAGGQLRSSDFRDAIAGASRVAVKSHSQSEGSRPLKIAQVAPLYEAVPPRLYGGTERIVAHLTNALVDLGHDVTLFASADARSRATVAASRDQAIRLDPCELKSELAAHLAMLHEVHRRRREFDIIHFHVDLIHFPFFAEDAARTVTTLHGRLDLKDLAEVYAKWPNFPLVSISNDQRRPLAGANWRATIQHGLPPDLYSFTGLAEGGYLAFLGRISPEKRVDRAIAIARRLGMPLKIAAKVDHADRFYFRQVIEPLLADPLVEFIGEIGDAEKPGFLGNAKALLFPIDWPEPFGLVMIEAMACGTPVIAWRCGSVPEVIDHGTSGYIVETMDEALAAVERLDRIDRRQVRATFDRRFTAEVMARNYLQLYRQLGHKLSPDSVQAAGLQRSLERPAMMAPASSLCQGAAPGDRANPLRRIDAIVAVPAHCPEDPLAGEMPPLERDARHLSTHQPPTLTAGRDRFLQRSASPASGVQAARRGGRERKPKPFLDQRHSFETEA